jgi:hypothetical protein
MAIFVVMIALLHLHLYCGHRHCASGSTAAGGAAAARTANACECGARDKRRQVVGAQHAGPAHFVLSNETRRQEVVDGIMNASGHGTAASGSFFVGISLVVCTSAVTASGSAAVSNEGLQ